MSKKCNILRIIYNSLITLAPFGKQHEYDVKMFCHLIVLQGFFSSIMGVYIDVKSDS
jgi:hypothetical protein